MISPFTYELKIEIHISMNVNYRGLSKEGKKGPDEFFRANWEICTDTFDKNESNTYGINFQINVLSEEIHLSLEKHVIRIKPETNIRIIFKRFKYANIY